MASAGAMSEGPASASTEVPPPLVGNVGQEFVQNTLSGNDPRKAVELIQQKGSFRDSRCQPLLGLLDQLGLERAESHKYVVKKASAALLEKIPKLSSDTLLSLLEETFPFIGIVELRAVPLAVLERLYPIPPNFVKQLAMDNEVFWDLPGRVQRQVWEMDKKLLQLHALSLIAAYKYETATWMQGLDMEIGVRDVGDAPPQLGRKMLRMGSAALRRLTEMVGNSTKIYRGISDICTVRYSDPESMYVGMKEAAICACRTQLLMSLHENGQATVCATDSCFSLVWALDTCIREKEITDARLSEIEHFLKSAHRAQLKRTGSEKTQSVNLISLKQHEREEDAESAGIPGIHQTGRICRDLGDAGMCLRDPLAFHIIVHEIIRRIENCVELDMLPWDDDKLRSLTRLLTLATQSRYMLHNDKYYYPDIDRDIMKNLYPCIAGFILDAKLMDMGEVELLLKDSDAMADAHREVVFTMVRNEIARKVVQIFSLERLKAEDLWIAESLLELIASCLEKIASAAIPEFAPFAFTLARRISTMIQNEKIKIDSNLWHVAVEKILLPLVDSETEAHKEIIFMLMAAAPKLEISRLGKYLDTCIELSSRSRQLHADRALEESALPPREYLGLDSSSFKNPAHRYDDNEQNEYDDEGYMVGDSQSGDGVRGTYTRIFSKHPDLGKPGIAPMLKAYLKID